MPGTSGVLSPFGKIKGLYFNDSKEPDDVMYNLAQDISKLMKEEGVEFIGIDCETKEDYYKIIDALAAFNDNAIKVSCTSKRDLNIIIENATEDEDEEQEEKSEE